MPLGGASTRSSGAMCDRFSGSLGGPDVFLVLPEGAQPILSRLLIPGRLADDCVLCRHESLSTCPTETRQG